MNASVVKRGGLARAWRFRAPSRFGSWLCGEQAALAVLPRSTWCTGGTAAMAMKTTVAGPEDDDDWDALPPRVTAPAVNAAATVAAPRLSVLADEEEDAPLSLKRGASLTGMKRLGGAAASGGTPSGMSFQGGKWVATGDSAASEAAMLADFDDILGDRPPAGSHVAAGGVPQRPAPQPQPPRHDDDDDDDWDAPPAAPTAKAGAAGTSTITGSEPAAPKLPAKTGGGMKTITLADMAALAPQPRLPARALVPVPATVTLHANGSTAASSAPGRGPQHDASGDEWDALPESHHTASVVVKPTALLPVASATSSKPLPPADEDEEDWDALPPRPTTTASAPAVATAAAAAAAAPSDGRTALEAVASPTFSAGLSSVEAGGSSDGGTGFPAAQPTAVSAVMPRLERMHSASVAPGTSSSDDDLAAITRTVQPGSLNTPALDSIISELLVAGKSAEALLESSQAVRVQQPPPPPVLSVTTAPVRVMEPDIAPSASTVPSVRTGGVQATLSDIPTVPPPAPSLHGTPWALPADLIAQWRAIEAGHAAMAQHGATPVLHTLPHLPWAFPLLSPGPATRAQAPLPVAAPPPQPPIVVDASPSSHARHASAPAITAALSQSPITATGGSPRPPARARSPLAPLGMSGSRVVPAASTSTGGGARLQPPVAAHGSRPAPTFTLHAGVDTAGGGRVPRAIGAPHPVAALRDSHASPFYTLPAAHLQHSAGPRGGAGGGVAASTAAAAHAPPGRGAAHAHAAVAAPVAAAASTVAAAVSRGIVRVVHRAPAPRLSRSPTPVQSRGRGVGVGVGVGASGGIAKSATYMAAASAAGARSRGLVAAGGRGAAVKPAESLDPSSFVRAASCTRAMRPHVVPSITPGRMDGGLLQQGSHVVSSGVATGGGSGGWEGINMVPSMISTAASAVPPTGPPSGGRASTGDHLSRTDMHSASLPPHVSIDDVAGAVQERLASPTTPTDALGHVMALRERQARSRSRGTAGAARSSRDTGTAHPSQAIAALLGSSRGFTATSGSGSPETSALAVTGGGSSGSVLL